MAGTEGESAHVIHSDKELDQAIWSTSSVGSYQIRMVDEGRDILRVRWIRHLERVSELEKGALGLRLQAHGEGARMSVMLVQMTNELQVEVEEAEWKKGKAEKFCR